MLFPLISQWENARHVHNRCSIYKNYSNFYDIDQRKYIFIPAEAPYFSKASPVYSQH